MTEEHKQPRLESIEAYRGYLAQLEAFIVEAWALYQPHLKCRAGCFGCCKNDFHISVIEAREVKRAVSELPEEQRRRIQENLDGDTGGYCPLLLDGQCAIYADRPVVCRVFGFPISDWQTTAVCELNFTENPEMLHTARSFNTIALGETLMALSGLYLVEMGEEPSDWPTPMFLIEEVLRGRVKGLEMPLLKDVGLPGQQGQSDGAHDHERHPGGQHEGGG